MAFVASVCRGLLGLVLLSAGMDKAFHFRLFLRAAKHYLPHRLQRPAWPAALLVGLEILSGVGLVLDGVAFRPSVWLATVLMMCFVAIQWKDLISPVGPEECGCGGILGPQGSPGWRLFRNLLLVCACGPLFLTRPAHVFDDFRPVLVGSLMALGLRAIGELTTMNLRENQAGLTSSTGTARASDSGRQEFALSVKGDFAVLLFVDSSCKACWRILAELAEEIDSFHRNDLVIFFDRDVPEDDRHALLHDSAIQYLVVPDADHIFGVSQRPFYCVLDKSGEMKRRGSLSHISEVQEALAEVMGDDRR